MGKESNVHTYNDFRLKKTPDILMSSIDCSACLVIKETRQTEKKVIFSC
jgi:hypothetical protein